MRLGQLARKLSQRPSEIVDFLASQSIKIEEGVNTRLEDEQVDLILRKFAPDMLNSIAEDTPEVTTPLIAEVHVDEIPEVVEEIQEQVPATIQPDQEVSLIESPDIIKAPKVALSGLKVLGKIELPSPKAKEPIPESENSEAKTETPAVARPNFERKTNERSPRREQRPYKNPVALKREHEEKAEQKKREEQAAQRKEKKTQNYLRKVTMSPPTKAVRLIDEEVESMTAEELAPQPTSWLGKFVNWLRN